MKEKKMKKLLSYVLLCALVIANLVSNGMVSKASGSQTVNMKATMDTVEVKAGGTQHVSIPFKFASNYSISLTSIENVDISVNADETPISVTSNVVVLEKNSRKEVSTIVGGIDYVAEFDIESTELASNGTYKLELTGTGYAYTIDEDTTCSLVFSKKLSVKVTGQKTSAKVKMSGIDYEEEVARGDEFSISLQVKNSGDLVARDVRVSLGDFSSQTDIVPNYSTSETSVGDVATGISRNVEFPVKVTANAAAGIKSLKLTVEWYDDKKGEGYTETANIFINVVVPEDQVQNNGKPNIVISNVVQSPSAPTAKGKVTVAFTVENKGKTSAKQLKFTPSNIASSGLSPVSAKPYVYIDELKAGKKKTVKMEYVLSEDITEGLHELTYAFTYKYLNKDGSDYEEGSESVSLFVRDVKNPKEATNPVNTSVPKLIISDFSTGDEKLKAGDVFTFTFNVKNTHASIAAKNIKVTVSSENNTFSQTSGSNSFYIDQIPAGATATQTIELKIKADTASNAYPLKVTFDYEYEGKSVGVDGKTEESGTAEKTIEEVLNVQVSENARPVVQDIYISSYDVPRVNESTTLTFNFYNMGKSTLNNVTATVVSDFYQAADTSTKFIGNVEAGQGNTYEIDVIPMMAGDCPGQLKITYEDSNGDTVELFADFTQYIEDQVSMDVPIDSMFPEDMPTVPEAKKALLPTWLFVVIEVVVFIVAIFIARKVVIGLYKRKLRKQEDDEL